MDYKERSTVWKTDHVLAVCDGITRAFGLEYIFTRKCPLPFRPHRQADMLTKCLSIAYDRDASCPTWDTFLWRIMGGSQGSDDPDTMSALDLDTRQKTDERARELIAYLQRAAGYTLTGSTREQCLFLCHGPTKTGKSTYLAEAWSQIRPLAVRL